MSKKRKNEKIYLNFASLCFASKQKLLNRSEAKNLKQKKRKKWKNAKNSEKNEKKRKKRKKQKKRKIAKIRLEFRFALFRFEAKITQAKRSDKFEAKISEKKQKKRSEILLWNSETHVKRIQIRFYFAYKRKKFFSETGSP